MFNIESADEKGRTSTSDGVSETELLINLIPDQSILDPLSRLEQEEAIAQMRQSIESLPERLKTVITLYYYQEMTMSQIGSFIGVNESCVSKLHAKALLNLKAAMLDATKRNSKRATGLELVA